MKLQVESQVETKTSRQRRIKSRLDRQDRWLQSRGGGGDELRWMRVGGARNWEATRGRRGGGGGGESRAAEERMYFI